MEIPAELKNLYKHWEKHARYQQANIQNFLPSELEWFVSERMKIWEQKYTNTPKPYTQDKILQKYKFCNIYRELDKQTIALHSHTKELLPDFPKWLLNVAFHRFICKTETIQSVGLLSLSEEENRKVYKNLMDLPYPKYGNAYVFPISILAKTNFPTREKFLCYHLPTKIRQISNILEAHNDLTVNEALKLILPTFELNFKFHWTEILIDVAYQFPSKINLFKDFHVGPGALPTAKILEPNKTPNEVVDDCVDIKLKNFPFLTFNGNAVKLSAENWEGIFCEFRKYTNLKNGSGRVRLFNKNENNKL